MPDDDEASVLECRCLYTELIASCGSSTRNIEDSSTRSNLSVRSKDATLHVRISSDGFIYMEKDIITIAEGNDLRLNLIYRGF